MVSDSCALIEEHRVGENDDGAGAFRGDRCEGAVDLAAPGPNGVPQLQMEMTVQFYTTDISAGPGSIAGSTQATPAAGTTPTPGASTAPGATNPAPNPSGT